MTGSKILTFSTGPIGKLRWLTRSLIDWGIFDLSSESPEWDSTKFDKEQDLNVYYQNCVFRSIEKTRWPPGLLLADIFSTCPLKLLNGIQRNLIGSKISTSSNKLVFFGLIVLLRWSPWPLIGWDIFDFRPLLKMVNGIRRNFTGKKILKLYCGYKYKRLYMINCTCIWGQKQLWLQVNGNGWYHLHWLRWAVRNGRGAKNQNENICLQRDSNPRPPLSDR